jgi:hypothetical protein
MERCAFEHVTSRAWAPRSLPIAARRPQGPGALGCCRGRPEVPGRPDCPGPVAIGLLDVLPVMRHATAEYAYLRQSVRTNNAAVVAVRYLAPREPLTCGRWLCPVNSCQQSARTLRRHKRPLPIIAFPIIAFIIAGEPAYHRLGRTRGGERGTGA